MVVQLELARPRVVPLIDLLSAKIPQRFHPINLAKAKASTACAQMAAVLRRIEITVVKLLGEMQMPESIASANRNAAGSEPAHGFAVFTLHAVPVSVVAKLCVGIQREISRVISNVCMPAL